MKNFKFLLLCFIAASVGLTSCKKNDGEPEVKVNPEETITNVAEKLDDKPELSTFTEAFKSVSLSQEDVAEGITIFAPTNDAVSEYPSVAIASIGKGAKVSADSVSKLTQAVLKDHIVKGVLTLNDLTDGKTFTSISGKQYKILRSGDTIRINGVRLNVGASGTKEMIYTVNKILSNSKVTDTVSNPVSACRLSKATYSPDEYQIFQYDSQNRLIKVTYYYNNEVDEEFTYTYSGSQIIRKIYEEGELLETLTYQTVNGRVASSTVTEQDTVTDVFTDSLGNTTTTTSARTVVRTTVFEHNTDGFLTKRLETAVFTMAGSPATTTSRDTTTYTYQNGNLVAEAFANSYGRGTKVFEYYTDKKNTLLPAGDEDDFLLTKPNKNPVKKVTYGAQQQGEVYNYTYLYNADGLIMKESVSEAGGQQPSSSSTDFVYNCE